MCVFCPKCFVGIREAFPSPRNTTFRLACFYRIVFGPFFRDGTKSYQINCYDPEDQVYDCK